MATQLKSKPGISGATTLSIPKDWDPAWFRHFIHNQLKGADVRNAISGAGISITGNLSSPYATISASGLIGSVVGTANEIAVSTVAGVATISFAPNIIIPAAANDTVVLTVDGSELTTANSRSMIVTAANGDARLAISSNNSTGSAGDAQLNLDTFGVQNWVIGNKRSDGSIRVSASQTLGTGDKLKITPTGASTFFSNGGNVLIADSTATFSFSNFLIAASSQTLGTWGLGMDSSDNFSISRIDSLHTALQISLAGNTTLPTPTGGITLTVGSVSGNPAIDMNGSGAGLYQAGTVIPAIAMNASGTDYGIIGNSSAGQIWGLGFNNNNAANGNWALRWTYASGVPTAPCVIIGPGSSTISSFSTSTRAVMELDSGTSGDALIDFSTNGSTNAYIYNGGPELRLNAELSGATITFYANGLVGLVSNANTVFAAQKAGFVTSGNATYQRGANTGGFLDGNYPNVASGADPGCIYTLGGNSSGTSYYPNATSLNTMYGIGYTLGNVSGITAMGQPAAWGMYTSSAGTGRHFLDADNGNYWCTGAMVPHSGGGNAMYFSGSGISIPGAGGKVTAQAGGTASGGNPGDIILIY